MLMKEERQQLLIDQVESKGRVLVVDIARQLGVTEDTIRKDLRELADKGLMQRVHGGAIKVDTELSRFESRVDLDRDEKTQLAQAAMDIIASHRVVFIDGGSTNFIAAQSLPKSFDGTVITNNPAVALLLADRDRVEVNILPGVIHHKSKEAVGSRALAAIKELHCDLVLLGISSIDPKRGMTMPYLESAETKKALIEAGSTVMGLATRAKFDRVSTYYVADCDALDILVTTQDPDKLEDYWQMGIDVRTV